MTLQDSGKGQRCRDSGGYPLKLASVLLRNQPTGISPAEGTRSNQPIGISPAEDTRSNQPHRDLAAEGTRSNQPIGISPAEDTRSNQPMDWGYWDDLIWEILKMN